MNDKAKGACETDTETQFNQIRDAIQELLYHASRNGIHPKRILDSAVRNFEDEWLANAYWRRAGINTAHLGADKEIKEWLSRKARINQEQHTTTHHA